jgi:hypothetical protein
VFKKLFLKKERVLVCGYFINVHFYGIFTICSYCSKTSKDLKESRIKCKKCNKKLECNDNHFKASIVREEKSLKKELEDPIRKFFQFYDEFIQNKTQLESDVYDHFQKMRFHVDEQRERLK